MNKSSELSIGIRVEKRKIDDIKFANYLLKKDHTFLKTLQTDEKVTCKLVDGSLFKTRPIFIKECLLSEGCKRILSEVDIDHGLEKGMKIVRGSIKDQQVDVIVNQISQDGKKCIDPNLDDLLGKVILQKIKLQKHNLRKKLIIATDAGNLTNVKGIYNVAFPSDCDNQNVFRKLYQSIFEKAEQDKIKTIAIPFLCTTKLNYKKSILAFTLVSETIAFLENTKVRNIEKVVFPLSDPETFKIFINEYIQIKLSRSKSRIVDASSPIQESYKWDFGNIQYSVSKGNILQFEADTIINTIGNSNILDSMGKISKELERQGGEEYRRLCKEIAPVENVQIMPSVGCIKSKYIIHMMAPRIPQREAWIDRIASSFLLAEEKKLKSVVIPAFGTGHCGNQGNDMALITMEAIELFCKHNPKSVEQINVVIFQESLFPIYKKWSKQIKRGMLINNLKTELYSYCFHLAGSELQ